MAVLPYQYFRTFNVDGLKFSWIYEDGKKCNCKLLQNMMYLYKKGTMMYNSIKTGQYFTMWQLCRSCRDKSYYHDYINISTQQQ